MNDKSVTKNLEMVMRAVVELASRSGIDSQDLSRLFEKAVSEVSVEAEVDDEQSLSKGAQEIIHSMLSLWRTIPEYLDTMGESLALPRYGAIPSIQTLHEHAVTRFNKGDASICSDEAIDLLLERGVVHKNAKDQFERVTDNLPVKMGGTVSVSAQTRFLADLASTISHNLSNVSGPGMFCGTSTVDAFPPTLVKKIEKLCWTDGMEFLVDVDNELLSGMGEADNCKSSDRVRAGVGLYLVHREPDDP